MKTLLLLAISSWLVLGMLFPALPTLRRLKAHKHEMGLVLLIPIYLSLAIGILADVLFNAIWGTIIFRERPREYLFTSRLQRHWNGPSAKQYARAAPWVARVNLIDPGHVNTT